MAESYAQKIHYNEKTSCSLKVMQVIKYIKHTQDQQDALAGKVPAV